MKNFNDDNDAVSKLKEEQPVYIGFVQKSEDEKLKEDIFRSPVDKLHLFTRMLKREALYKKAKISHT